MKLSSPTAPVSNKTADPKPKRPLTAYNLFFRQERANILEAKPVRPEGKPRRSHGKIGFAELARTVAGRWKNLSASEKYRFESLAQGDKDRYNRELKVWNQRQKESQTEKQDEKAILHGPDMSLGPSYYQPRPPFADYHRRMSAPAICGNHDVPTCDHLPEPSPAFERSHYKPFTTDCKTIENSSSPDAFLPLALEKVYQQRVHEFCVQERQSLFSEFFFNTSGSLPRQQKRTEDYLSECLELVHDTDNESNFVSIGTEDFSEQVGGSDGFDNTSFQDLLGMRASEAVEVPPLQLDLDGSFDWSSAAIGDFD